MVNKQNVKMMTVAAIIGVSAIGATTAFAAGSSSTQPRYTLREIPSYPSGSCAFTDRKCADAAADGKNSPVSRGDNVYWSYATARNNTEEPQPQGSTPELATSASTIKYKVRYRGTQDAAAGHLAYYQYGADLMRESGSGWIKHGGCYPAVHGRWHQTGDLNQDLLGDQFRHQHMPDESAAPDGCCRVSFRKRRHPRPPFRQQPRNHPEAGDVHQPLRGRI